MKLAAPFTLNPKFTELPDEYILRFRENADPEALLDFAEAYSEKDISLIFEGIDINIDLLEQAVEKNPNIKVCLYNYQMGQIDELKEKNLKFYFSQFDYPCSCMSFLDDCIRLGVSDIYVADDLRYNLRNVKTVCNKNNIKIRMVLNRTHTLSQFGGFLSTDPFYCPKDYEALSEYVDIGEFDCGLPYHWDWFEDYYNAWYKYHDYIGSLSDINPDLYFNYPVQHAYKNFNRVKMTCQRHCLWDDSCGICQRNYLFLQDMEKTREKIEEEVLDSIPEPLTKEERENIEANWQELLENLRNLGKDLKKED